MKGGIQGITEAAPFTEVIIINIGFIGSGKVGCSLARWFRHKGMSISGFYSRSGNEYIRDFDFYGSADELVKNSDMIFITVTDSAIPAVWSGLDKTIAAEKTICHCSGSLPADIFCDAAKYGIKVCSLHPMQAFDSRNVSFDKISDTFFTIEGSAADEAERLMKMCGCKYRIIDGKNKALYHAAAVFASNFEAALAYKAQTMLEQCGFSSDEALYALAPMLRSNIDNVCTRGAAAALTGPIERNDTATVEKHLNCINDGDKALYRELAKATVQLAKIKHPDMDYTELYQKLED